MINLADPRIGSKIIYKTDDFFAAANRILNLDKPVFKDGLFDKHGKWMDGWETRRRRSKGFDYLILKLGKPGKIFDIDIDTTHFNGNQLKGIPQHKFTLRANYELDSRFGPLWLNISHSYTGDFSASGIERAFDRVPSREITNASISWFWIDQRYSLWRCWK